MINIIVLNKLILFYLIRVKCNFILSTKTCKLFLVILETIPLNKILLLIKRTSIYNTTHLKYYKEVYPTYQYIIRKFILFT